MSNVATVQGLAAAGLVSFGGDCVFSMGGRGVNGADVVHALCNAVTVEDRGSFFFITGPAVDGSKLEIVAKISECIKVSDVCL